MATVIPDRFRDGNRAQLMLVGGLALAVTIVVLALVLNSAIYTHNLASRSDSAASESLTLDEDTRRGVGGIMDSVNSEETGDDFPGLVSDYDTALGSWESSTRNLTGSNGRAMSVTASSEREGVRIEDDDSSSFGPRSGSTSSWTVAEQVRVRQFGMEVSAGALFSEDTSDIEADLLGSGAFTVIFDDGTSEWQVAVYEDADTGGDDVSVTVHKDGASTYETCTVPRSEVIIDFTDAELGPETCEALAFLEELDGPYDVRFEDGDEIGGRYELTVDRMVDGSNSETGPFTNAVDAANAGRHCDGPTYYSADSGNFPRVSPAIYSAEVETEFVGSDTVVRGAHRIAPDEPGAGPVTPRVTEFTVNEETSSDGDFTVDWAVEDPNGDLFEVRLSVNGNPAATKSVNGDSGSGSNTPVSGSSTPYTIEITVEDTDGNVRSTTRTHDDDAAAGGCPT